MQLLIAPVPHSLVLFIQHHIVNEPYNDARRNLIMAMIFASRDSINEVTIFFTTDCCAPIEPQRSTLTA